MKQTWKLNAMHDPLLDARPEWTLLWRTMLGQVARFEWGLYIKESNMAKKKRNGPN